MNKTLKMLLKLLLKKNYRDYLLNVENEGRIEDIQTRIDAEQKVIILQRKNQTVGLFSDYIVFLRMIEQSIEQGCIPIIDRKTYKNIFYIANEKVNTWEDFFEQPCMLSLDDLDDTMDIKVNHIASAVSPVSIMHSIDETVVCYWRNVAKKYIRFNENIKSNLEYEQKNHLEGKRVLGIAFREGYIKLSETEKDKIGNHPVQASVEEMVELAKKYKNEWNCDHVFFSCQTIETEKYIKKCFPNCSSCVNKNRPSYENLLEGSKLKIMDKTKQYENELKYLTEIYLLSQCTSFICSENSGAEAAFIMSDGFEHFLCVQKGLYQGGEK